MAPGAEQQECPVEKREGSTGCSKFTPGLGQSLVPLDRPPERGSPWGRGSWGCAESGGPVRCPREDTRRQ